MKTAFTILFSLLVAASLVAQEGVKEEISRLLDEWHRAAASNDQEAYFMKIDDQGVYIGTDSSEIWTKQEFYDWSTPYFDDAKGWSFSRQSRNIYLSENGLFAWFDELLDYAKGTLRGSGVLVKRENEWKIIHYVLSLPVPNEKYNEVMKIIGSKNILTNEREE